MPVTLSCADDSSRQFRQVISEVQTLRRAAEESNEGPRSLSSVRRERMQQLERLNDAMESMHINSSLVHSEEVVQALPSNPLTIVGRYPSELNVVVNWRASTEERAGCTHLFQIPVPMGELNLGVMPIAVEALYPPCVKHDFGQQRPCGVNVTLRVIHRGVKKLNNFVCAVHQQTHGISSLSWSGSTRQTVEHFSVGDELIVNLLATVTCPGLYDLNCFTFSHSDSEEVPFPRQLKIRIEPTGRSPRAQP